MAIEYPVFAMGAILVLVVALIVLIWKMQLIIDMRLSEIQADIGDLHNAVSRLFVIASNAKSEADTSKIAPKISNAEPTFSENTGMPSHGLEAELHEVDELCAKLITLVPPAKLDFGQF
jgi:hypothetical protein